MTRHTVQVGCQHFTANVTCNYINLLTKIVLYSLRIPLNVSTRLLSWVWETSAITN
jgi:hypothetical protein